MTRQAELNCGISLTPGFNRVISDSFDLPNRFNGLLPEANQKPLKRFPRFKQG